MTNNVRFAFTIVDTAWVVYNCMEQDQIALVTLNKIFVLGKDLHHFELKLEIALLAYYKLG